CRCNAKEIATHGKSCTAHTTVRLRHVGLNNFTPGICFVCERPRPSIVKSLMNRPVLTVVFINQLETRRVLHHGHIMSFVIIVLYPICHFSSRFPRILLCFTRETAYKPIHNNDSSIFHAAKPPLPIVLVSDRLVRTTDLCLLNTIVGVVRKFDPLHARRSDRL